MPGAIVVDIAMTLSLTACTTTQVKDDGRELGRTAAGTLMLLAIGGPEAVNEHKARADRKKQMARNKTLTQEQRQIKH